MTKLVMVEFISFGRKMGELNHQESPGVFTVKWLLIPLSGYKTRADFLQILADEPPYIHDGSEAVPTNINLQTISNIR